MTKEQLEALGLDAEQIKEVFKLNGIAVNNAKGDLDAKETELAETKKLLEDANKEIEGFKDLDVAGIKKAAEDYKIKFEETEQKAKEELEKVKFEHELKETARDFKAKNTKAVLALIDKEALLESKNRKEDIKKAFEEVAGENEFLFDVEDTQEGKPKFSRPNGSGGPMSMSKDDIMSMTDPIERKQKIAENIELFK